MSAKRYIPPSPKLRAARGDGLIDLIVTPYDIDPSKRLKGNLKESAPSIPEWMLTKPRKRRVGDYDDSADRDNVMAGLDSEMEF